MAETSEPDFSAFEDWLVDGPAGQWLPVMFSSNRMTEYQERIVADNARCLLNRDVWNNKVQAFEAALTALGDETYRSKFNIRFDHHIFEDGKKNFSGYHFPCSVSFSGVNFGDGDLSFERVSFANGDISFNRVEFGKGSVNFDRVRFGAGGISFNGAVFGNDGVWFNEASFGDGDVNFTGALFGGEVRFNQACFGTGFISFSWVEFGNGAVFFDSAEFGDGGVSFVKTNFGDGNIRFDRAQFGQGKVDFNAAHFGDGFVSFRLTYVGGGSVSFRDVNLKTTIVRASDMVVSGNLTVKSDFPTEVDFSRLHVSGTASFSGSSFDKVPDFTDAKFDRPPEVAGMVVPPPILKGWNRLASDPEDVAKFRKLKAMALAANDHEKDGEFFASEMLAKRGTETTTKTSLFVNWLYWKLSDFGQSFTRPFWSWLGTLLLFAAVNVGVISIGIPATLATISSRFDAMAFSTFLSLKNSIPLLGSLFRFAPAPEGHTGWFQDYYDTLEVSPATVDWLIRLGVVENIIGGVLLFLFLLALRNKFRLK